jgi:hypothetical protein
MVGFLTRVTINDIDFRRELCAARKYNRVRHMPPADLRIGPNYPLEWCGLNAAKLCAKIGHAHNLVFGLKQTTARVLQGTLEASTNPGLGPGKRIA